jgi:prevent-host-death family protein
MCYMERIGVRELRQNASQYLDRVAAGEVIEVTQRGQLIARIIPATTDPWAALIASGEVTPARSPRTDALALPGRDYGVDLSAELYDLRDGER